MKRVMLLLLLLNVLGSAHADIALPKYRQEKKSLKISGVKKYSDYRWFAKVDYQNNEDSEFEIVEDPQVLDYMHYKENNVEVTIWAINKETKAKTKPVVFKMPYSKGYTIFIKGVKKNKIKNKQKENAAVIAFKMNTPNNTSSNSLLPLALVSLISLCCFFLVRKQFAVKLQA